MGSRDKAMRVDRIADYLVGKFKAPGSRKFFCKCALHMSEDEIMTIYESAIRPEVKNPIKYFVVACRNHMSRR